MTSDTFLGGSVTFWTGIQAIGVLISTVLVVFTGYLLYRQVRIAEAPQLEGIRYAQTLVDGFHDERTQLFRTFPIEMVAEAHQFPRRPPGRQVRSGLSEGERRDMGVNEAQSKALDSLTEAEWSLARTVINKLNDIWQLVEDGYVDRQIFLGKYHTMLIRLCHFLEFARREMEEKEHGGNYGQRLLRMRHVAITFNTINPKHRDVRIMISGHTRGGEAVTKVIVERIEKASLPQKMLWEFQRRFSLY
jgi:hypothetical protein